MSGAAVLDDMSTESVDPEAAVGWFRDVALAMVGADLRHLDDDRLLDAAAVLEGVRRVLDGAVGEVLAEAEGRGVTDTTRGMRTGSWLAHETGQPCAPCRRRVSVAARVWREFPLVARAAREGRLSWSHAEVICHAANPRIAAELAERTPMLIALAAELDFDPWKRRVDELAARLDRDGGFDPGDDESSKLYVDPISPDVTILRGVFVGASGAELRAIVNRRADQVRRRLRRDAETTGGELAMPSRAVLRAMALEELLLEGHAAGSRSSSKPVTGLTVVLRPDADGAVPVHFETPDRGGIGWRSLADRLCDAAVEFLATDPSGVPLRLGRTQRFASPGQRRAANVRDGGCVFPGCDCPEGWVDLHHVRRQTDGGSTDLQNLACLCRYHHGVTHRAGWTMHATADQWFWWTTPSGATFWSQRHGQQRAGPTPRC